MGDDGPWGRGELGLGGCDGAFGLGLFDRLIPLLFCRLVWHIGAPTAGVCITLSHWRWRQHQHTRNDVKGSGNGVTGKEHPQRREDMRDGDEKPPRLYECYGKKQDHVKK